MTETLALTKTSAFRVVSTLIFKNYLQKNETTKKLPFLGKCSPWVFLQ
ncbi:hypothetical protein M601_008835 [Cellulophaga baltica 4]|nr:hypothetical protein M601_008835 [Cellulophaga baltica 4]